MITGKHHDIEKKLTHEVFEKLIHILDEIKIKNPLLERTFQIQKYTPSAIFSNL